MVRIITDSAADFEPHELEKLQVSCIPLTVFFGEDEYHENVSLTKDQFYSLIASTGLFPKTSQASPQVLLDLLDEAEAAGDDAVYITLSGALSGTYQNAVMAKNLTGFDRFTPIDSRNATGGQRMLVEYAVRLRDEGKTAAEIVEGVEKLRSRIVLYACMDTLEYLYRGGRISQTAYKLGSIANIKPIIRVEADGSIGVPAKAMGMRKGMDYLCKQAMQNEQDPQFPFYAMYTGVRTNGEQLAQRLRELGFDIPPERIINVGAAIGSHVGPNACGFVYVRKEKEA